MPNTPDNTPSAESRALHPDRNPSSDYGGRWEMPGAGAVGSTVEVVSVELSQPEQLDLFDQPVSTQVESLRQPIKYGHVQGASARRLRDADRAYIRSQLKGK